MDMCGEQNAPSVERRSGVDRRKLRRIPLLSPYRRRRSPGRRATDRRGYVDVYDMRTWLVALAIVVLSLLDAWLTALQIRAGRVAEANPLMARLLSAGGMPMFFGIKAAMTALPLALIVLHKEWALGRFAARLCLWCYVCILLYHLFLALAAPLLEASLVRLLAFHG